MYKIAECFGFISLAFRYTSSLSLLCYNTIPCLTLRPLSVCGFSMSTHSDLNCSIIALRDNAFFIFNLPHTIIITELQSNFNTKKFPLPIFPEIFPKIFFRLSYTLKKWASFGQLLNACGEMGLCQFNIRLRGFSLYPPTCHWCIYESHRLLMFDMEFLPPMLFA